MNESNRIEGDKRGNLKVRLRIDLSHTATNSLSDHASMEWQPIATAPFGRDLELAVIDAGRVHALVFACRRTIQGWVKSATGKLIHVHPTHWREWI